MAKRFPKRRLSIRRIFADAVQHWIEKLKTYARSSKTNKVLMLDDSCEQEYTQNEDGMRNTPGASNADGTSNTNEITKTSITRKIRVAHDPACSCRKCARRASKKAAQEIYIRNFAESPIYQLPPEIIYRIERFGDAVDSMSLEVSGRKFRALLRDDPLRHRIDNIEQEKEFRELLEKDRYRTLVHDEEAVDIKEQGSMLCSACRKSHSKSGFLAGAENESPFTRRCKGTTGRFRLGDDETTTFADLKEFLPSAFKCSKGITYYGDRAPYGIHTITLKNRTNRVFDPGMSRRNVWLYMTTMPLGLGDSGYTYMPAEKICDRLIELNVYICPHLRTSSSYIIEALKTKMRNQYAWVEPEGEMSGLGNTTSADCCERACDTTLSLSNFAGIQMAIVRRIGRLKDPLAERWVAQLEFDDREDSGNA